MSESVVHDVQPRPGVLVVGNFLSARRGTRSLCEDLGERLEARGWKVLRTSRQENKVLRLADMVATAVIRRNAYACAAVDVFSGPAFRWAEVVCQSLHLLGKSYLLTLHGGGLADFSRQHPRRVNQLLAGAAVITTPSLFLKKELSIIREDIRYLPNGLPIDDYPFRLRREVKPNLAWLRAFHEIYNPLMAVHAVDILRTDYPTIHLKMYGPDKGDGSLSRVKEHIARHGLESHISIPGVIPKAKVPEVLSNHDLFLNTTTLESFGVCVAEAAACGLPVVTTSVGELPFLYHDGEEALLVPSGDAAAMAAAVRRILTEPDLAEKLSRNARAKAKQFDWSNVLPQWERLFTQLAGDNVGAA